ncbi:MAG: hypothetical protein MJ196_12550 [Treponemataceae bacterium]|nr:hypothetical protein [Treponemataceae bacterium]
MEYTFAPYTKEQWLEFQLEITKLRYKNINRKQKTAYLAVLIVFSLLFAANIVINIIYFSDDSIRSIVLFLSGAFLFWYLTVPRLFFIPSYVKGRLEKHWAKGKNAGETTDTVKIADGVFSLAQSDGKFLTMPLKTVAGVIQTSSLIVVPLYPAVYEIIPKNIFATKEEEKEFLAALNCK